MPSLLNFNISCSISICSNIYDVQYAVEMPVISKNWGHHIECVAGLSLPLHDLGIYRQRPEAESPTTGFGWSDVYTLAYMYASPKSQDWVQS